MAAPILVLITCLPLLRPLRLPDPTRVSDNELERLATIQAIVEQKTLAIDECSILHTAGRSLGSRGRDQSEEGRLYSKQPPVLAAMLAGPYWIMHRLGLTFDASPTLAIYLLTLFGATLPVAAAAGLVYRMGRLFELRRPWRAVLAMAAVFGSGLLSYGTTLNSHAPAAALVLGGFGCLFHALSAKHKTPALGWMLLAGVNVAFAAVIDLAAVAFLVLLAVVILAARWPVSSKLAGIGFYVLGALPPLVLHASLTVPLSGDLRPLFLHPELCHPPHVTAPLLTAVIEDDYDSPGFIGTAITHLRYALLGPRGLISHFPILLLGLAGAATVIRRNWPAPTKTLAVVSMLAATLIVGAYIVLNPNWDQPMFAVRWFILFVPLIVFWAGAWLRQKHHPVTWTAAAIVLAFSIATNLIGATCTFTEARPGEYTAYVAARELLKEPSTQTASAANPLASVNTR